MKQTSFVQDIKQIKQLDSPTIGQVLEIFGTGSFGMALFILAIIVIVPTGIIPGIAVVTSICISLVVLQYAIGLQTIFVPKRIRQIMLSEKSINALAGHIEKHEKKIQNFFVPNRHKKFLTQPYNIISSLLLFAVSLTMIPLTLLPFIEIIPGIVVALFGLSLLFVDGTMMIMSWLAAISYLVVLVWFFAGMMTVIM